MCKEWCNVRIPAELHAELGKLAEGFNRLHEAGRVNLGNDASDRFGVPLHWVIARCVRELQDKRRRSNRKRPRGRQLAKDVERRAMSEGFTVVTREEAAALQAS